jgi:hypothetical protein
MCGVPLRLFFMTFLVKRYNQDALCYCGFVKSFIGNAFLADKSGNIWITEAENDNLGNIVGI